MSNQLLLWLSFIISWLSLPLMKKEARKRFIPAAFFSVFACLVAFHFGFIAKFWYFTEMDFTLIVCGVVPIATLWVIRFTYGRFWTYMITNLLIDSVYSFVIIPWYGRRGILGVDSLTPVWVLIVEIILAVLIYQYQKWQERIMRDF